MDLVGKVEKLSAVVFPGIDDALEDLLKRRHVIAVNGREISAAKKRPGIRGEENAHGPAALACNGNHRTHIDGIDIGAFFPVHLDVDKGVVHEACHLRVLERLVFHDVTPVAS